MKDIKSLIAKAKEITLSGLPFMEGREKGDMDDLTDATVTIVDYGFMNDDGKEYACFICKEHEGLFFFGGSVLTDSLQKLDEMLTDNEIAELLDNGIPTHFEKKKSKNKREYTKCTFFPNAE